MILLLLGLLAQAPPETPRQALTDKIAEIRREAARVVPANTREAVEARLGRAQTAVEADRLYLAAYELENAFETTRAFRFAADASDIDTLPEFTARWRRLGQSGQPVTVPLVLPHRQPVAIMALASAAHTRGGPTYRASLPYAEDAGVQAGLYYLGESLAFSEFHNFALALDWPAPPAPPRLRSIKPELDALDAEVTRAYETMTREQHPQYMLASVTLKRARALQEAGDHAAALLEYLLARYRFAPLRRASTPASAPPAASPTTAKAEFDDGADHSIARLFLEMAEAAPSDAAVILADVLPAYRAALAPPAPVTAAKAAPRVTITLVRWPFT